MYPYTGRWIVPGQNRQKIKMYGLVLVLVNLLVDFVRSTARSRRNLHFGGICCPDRPQKRYTKLDGVAKIWFYTGSRFSGRFCGRFGAKIRSNVDLGEIYILEGPTKSKNPYQMA